MNKIIIILLGLILIFGYFEFLEIRLMPLIFLLFVIVILISIIFNNLVIKWDVSIIISTLLVFIVLFFSIYTGSFDFFVSMAIFFTLAHWPLFISIKNPYKMYSSGLAIYIYSGLILSLGLFIQIFMFKFLGVVFGKTDLYGGGRLAFAFTWQDYSFLSLYFASCVPLVLSTNFRIKFILKLFLIAVLIVASLSTTARTGLVSLLISIVIYIIFNLNKIVIYKKIFYILIFIIPLYFLFAFFKDYNLVEREITADSSGRTEGYIEGFNYFANNIFLGSFFNPSHYKDNVGVIPHNLFVYLAVIGGLFLLFFAISWLLTIAIKVYRLDSNELIYSFVTCLIGFQFIPSIFSGYFLSILISLIFIKYKYRVNL